MIQQRNINITNIFSSPVLQERLEKRINIPDTKVIFDEIAQKHEYLTYDESVAYLSDLAYIVIPFDKTHREF